jgi:hypothetical protein
MQGRTEESLVLRGEIEPLLGASPSPYAKDLIARFAVR